MIVEDVREKQQLMKCSQFGPEYVGTPLTDKIGIAENVRSGLLPINGLRHPSVGDTSGWYIWAGVTISEEPDFFKPLHASHVADWCPQIESFLGLAPGWRFLIAGDYQDVWFDPELLRVE